MSPPERDGLPAHLRAFLYACIDAIEQVEILVLLLRSDGARTCRQVAAALMLTEPVTRVHLETLTARGLLAAAAAADVAYRFAPRTPELSAYAASLDAAFSQSRSEVLTFVAGHCGRTRRFASAFRWRDPDD
jgi:hypothetical protein